MGWTWAWNSAKCGLPVYGVGSKPLGTDDEHEPVPVCGGVGGGRPFSVAPFSVHVRSVRYASSPTIRLAPPTWFTRRSRNWPSYATSSESDAVALMSRSGSEYGPNGRRRSRRFCTFSKLVTSKLPPACWYGSPVLVAWQPEVLPAHELMRMGSM